MGLRAAVKQAVVVVVGVVVVVVVPSGRDSGGHGHVADGRGVGGRLLPAVLPVVPVGFRPLLLRPPVPVRRHVVLDVRQVPQHARRQRRPEYVHALGLEPVARIAPKEMKRSVTMVAVTVG